MTSDEAFRKLVKKALGNRPTTNIAPSRLDNETNELDRTLPPPRRNDSSPCQQPYAQIQARLKWGDIRATKDLSALRRSLEISFLLGRTDLENPLRLLAVIVDATRGLGCKVAPFSEESAWLTALCLANDCLVLTGTTTNSPYCCARSIELTNAVKFLRKRGFQIRIAEGEVSIEPKELGRLTNLIETHIVSAGAQTVADMLFERLIPTYDATQERYHIVRQVSATGASDDLVPVPFAYLLHLAVKHFSGAPTKSDSRLLMDEAIALSQALVGTLGIRMFAPFEIWIQPHQTLFQLFSKTAVYDAAHALTQSRPSDVPRVLRALFNWASPAEEERLGFSIQAFAAVAENTITQTHGCRGPGLVSTVTLEEQTCLPPHTVQAILNACAHDPNDVNSKFQLPWDSDRLTFWQKPLIRQDNDYLFVDPSWCSPSFYETLAREVRNVAGGKGTDERIGHALEAFVRAELGSRGVAIKHGSYKVGDIDGEVDAIIETEEVIVVIEVKKKALTRLSKKGEEFALLADLVSSLLDAQWQAAKLELLLYREERGLELTDDVGTTAPLLRGDRKVERIALTHLDFGSFQDRQVLFAFLDSVRNASGQTSDPAVRKLQKKFLRLTKLTDELAVLRPRHPHGDFFHCWFLSLGQLLVILDNVSSSDTFWTELSQSRRATTGTCDFYFEHAIARSRGRYDGAGIIYADVTQPPVDLGPLSTGPLTLLL